MKPVAKSLHTLTVLQQVAQMLTDRSTSVGPLSDPAAALDAAMSSLGLAGRPDPYGLRDRALALLLANPRL